MIPKQIRIDVEATTGLERLALLWDDGHQGLIPLRSLRDQCPCAGCQGETVLLKSYKPEPTPDKPGKYKVVGAQQVGSYALSVSWADGHQTGIYTWETLRALCECPSCLGGLQTS